MGVVIEGENVQTQAMASVFLMAANKILSFLHFLWAWVYIPTLCFMSLKAYLALRTSLTVTQFTALRAQSHIPPNQVHTNLVCLVRCLQSWLCLSMLPSFITFCLLEPLTTMGTAESLVLLVQVIMAALDSLLFFFFETWFH